ncbi:MAG: UDP-N-acetylmuramoyl-tripeptide--D-alanyl-D-alanine ligase [Saprospiraceae bacterium]
MISTQSLYERYKKHPHVYIDTRTMQPGGIFFGLKGERFDGGAFAAEALRKGAAYAVVDNPDHATNDKILLTTNALQALQDLARHHRRQFSIPVIAIGGSNGKTTTKELVAAVLSMRYSCHSTPGNFNNHIGVPLTLLAMPSNAEVAIVEMGANRLGDMTELCNIAEPTHGLLTNIGKEHLEGFGDIEGVKKGEGELYNYLDERKGMIFVNTSEKHLNRMCNQIKRKIIYRKAEYLHHNSNVIDVQLREYVPYVSVDFLSDFNLRVNVKSKLSGIHNFHNIMTAVALGIYFKIPADDIKAAIERYEPLPNRSQWIDYGSNRILLDAYNSNPSSALSAIKNLVAMPHEGKQLAILGDMLELGEKSQKEHEFLLRRIRQLSSKLHLALIGPEFGRCKDTKKTTLYFPNVEEAKVWFDKQHFTDTHILIKGSRAMRLEKLLDL